MRLEARKILKAAMALSPDERAALAHALLASLDATHDPSVAQAWAAEITRRAERFRAGESDGIPAKKVIIRVVERYRPK